jgi:hypothetical protein
MLGLTGRVRAALIVTVALAGCGGNVPVSRGFGSREVLPLRDSTIHLLDVVDIQGQDPCLDYTTRDQSGAMTAWSLDLVTGAPLSVCPQPDTGPAPVVSRYGCRTANAASDGTSTLQVTDSTTGVETDVDGVVQYAGCPGDDGVLSIFRHDPNGDGDLVLWSGPYQQLAVVAVPIEVWTVVRFRASSAAAPDAGAPAIPDVVVSGSVPGQPDAVGIYTIDLGSATVTNIVPATPASAAWATGAPQAGTLESSSVSTALAIYRFNGHYLYGRTMSDGGTTLFAGPYDAGPASELALFRIDAYSTLGQGLRVSPPDDSTAPVAVPAIASWELDGPGGSPSQLMVWDDTDAQVAVCPSTAGALQAGMLSPDGTHVLFSEASRSSLNALGPLQLLTLGAGGSMSCVRLGGENVLWGDYSGDGSMIAWFAETTPAYQAELWIANGDGTGAQMLFSGMLLGADFVSGTSKLELLYAYDLVWLDVRDPTHQLTHVAENLFGHGTSVGGSWFVGGYDYTSQDPTGVLGVIDLDTGKKLQISPAVSDYVVGAQALPGTGDMLSSTPQTTGVYHVAYVVYGRNPSSSDGIWMATVNAADLQ